MSTATTIAQEKAAAAVKRWEGEWGRGGKEGEKRYGVP
jgi:hypothetical protein